MVNGADHGATVFTDRARDPEIADNLRENRTTHAEELSAQSR